MPVFLLSERLSFPPPFLARKDGLLAIGGDLGIQRLLLAYRMGIFPWFVDGDPILWWSPDPRLVLYPSEIRVSKSLKKVIRKKIFRVSMDSAFESVIRGCAERRLEKKEGTWITDEMISAYCRLHALGFAHSVEAWRGDELAGGLYGISLGSCFFGESMFSKASNASKVALVALAKHLSTFSFDFIDCQVSTEHLIRFGAKKIPRAHFLKQLKKSLAAATRRGKWEIDHKWVE